MWKNSELQKTWCSYMSDVVAVYFDRFFFVI